MTSLSGSLLFWDPNGWCVDLREYRAYPDYGEWDWVARTNNTGIEEPVSLGLNAARTILDRLLKGVEHDVARATRSDRA